jgi:dihydroxyacetone kinase-like predicted kinase
MLDVWAKAAQESLQRTPDQLVVDGKYILRNAGVVDSGAKGYVLLIEGMQQVASCLRICV